MTPFNYVDEAAKCLYSYYAEYVLIATQDVVVH